jgi:putative methyltransferase (TIGR04325 family)
MKTLLRELLSRIPGIRFWVARAVFLGPNHNTHRFWGVFPTYAAAKAYVPRKFNQGFDAPNLEDFEEAIPERDENTIRVLSGLFPKVKRLFDLGGNVGMCFYQYRAKIAYPRDFQWTVCDVPFVNEKGRELAAKRMETQLAFTDDRNAADGADIFLTNGALQYFPESLADILAPLKNKPARLIINRVPLSVKREFFTLQHMGYSVVPYHIGHLPKFVAGLEALGYRLTEHWENDRFCEILLRPEMRVEHYYGFYFTRAESP